MTFAQEPIAAATSASRLFVMLSKLADKRDRPCFNLRIAGVMKLMKLAEVR
jgi:hypothetical protein